MPYENSLKIGKENMKVKDGVAFRATQIIDDGSIARVEAGGEPYRPRG
jgi:hypothetical protein